MAILENMVPLVRILNCIDVGVFLISEENTFLFVNLAAAEIWGGYPQISLV
ncbi:PAS domain-containing protein [Novacetimonas pomaceti]|uniref:PAS domain-containing protein n=1 Tax=Novacetimonas pomaceti TaxID=2021998 RepID=UPI0026A766C2